MKYNVQNLLGFLVDFLTSETKPIVNPSSFWQLPYLIYFFFLCVCTGFFSLVQCCTVGQECALGHLLTNLQFISSLWIIVIVITNKVETIMMMVVWHCWGASLSLSIGPQTLCNKNESPLSILVLGKRNAYIEHTKLIILSQAIPLNLL